MKVEFKRSFKEDLKKIKDKKILQKVKELINEIEKVRNLSNIQNINIKKIKGYEDFYRIRIGNYRIGIKIEGDKVIFVRILHRKDIYKYFP